MLKVLGQSTMVTHCCSFFGLKIEIWFCFERILEIFAETP